MPTLYTPPPLKVWSLVGAYMGQHVGHTEAVACLALDANFLFSGKCFHCVL